MITDSSPLFRDKFDPLKPQKGKGRGNHGHTRKDAKDVVISMTPHSIRQYYNRLLRSIGIKNKPKRRHEFSVNGFRKYFKTMAEQTGMAPINVEILMGHSVGISDSYYRPTEQSLREDYLKAVDKLTVISNSNAMVKLSESQQALASQMESKDEERYELREQVEEIRDLYQGLQKTLDEVVDLREKVRANPHKFLEADPFRFAANQKR